MPRREATIDELADMLAGSGADLGDERSCVLELIGRGIRGPRIDQALDEAVETARQIRLGAPALDFSRR